MKNKQLLVDKHPQPAKIKPTLHNITVNSLTTGLLEGSEWWKLSRVEAAPLASNHPATQSFSKAQSKLLAVVEFSENLRYDNITTTVVAIDVLALLWFVINDFV